MAKEIFDVYEVANYLGFGVTKIYILIAKKDIPASKVGKQYRFLRSEIDKWLKEKIIKAEKK